MGYVSRLKLLGIGTLLVLSLCFVLPLHYLLRAARWIGSYQRRKQLASFALSGLLLVATTPAVQAVTYDNSYANQQATTASSATESYTVGTGEHRYLLAFIKADNPISGVTYNGDAMTELTTSAGHPGVYATTYSYEFWLAEPDSGTHDLVVSFGSSKTTYNIVIASYADTNQTAPDVAGAWTFPDSDYTITGTLTVATENSWLVMFAQEYNNKAWTPGTSTTLRAEDNDSSGIGNGAVFDSNGGLETGSRSLTASRAAGYEATDYRIVALAPYTTPTSETPTTTTTSTDLAFIEEHLDWFLFGFAILILFTAGGFGYAASRKT